MNELNINEHQKIIKKILNLSENLKIYAGDKAIDYVRDNDENYKNKHGISLNNNLDNGLYLWWENENIVLIRDKTKIGTLAHEMRHAWQFKNKKFCFVKPTTKLEKCIEEIKYYVSSKELDANKYARYYCKIIGQEKMARYYLYKIIAIWLCRILPIIFIPYFKLINKIYKKMQIRKGIGKIS